MVLHPSAWRRPWEHPWNENNVVAQEHAGKMDCKRVSYRVGMCVCVYYCRTFYKAVRVGEEESGGHVL